MTIQNIKKYKLNEDERNAILATLEVLSTLIGEDIDEDYSFRNYDCFKCEELLETILENDEIHLDE